MLKELIAFVRDIKTAFTYWKEEQEQFKEEQFLADQLEVVDLPGDAAYNLGAAIELARNLGIELHKGLTRNDCRAVLPRENWRCDDGNPNEIFSYGQFLQKPRKDVTEIQMLNRNLCFAVAHCAIHAKRAKVI